MKRGLMALKDSSKGGKAAIAHLQDRQLRNGKMLPRNQRQQGRSDRAEDLRNQDDLFPANPIGQITCGQRQTNNWNRENKADQAEGGCRMRASVNFPFYGYCEHLPAEERQQISRGKKAEPA